MSGDVSDKKRLISIQKGNFGNNHIYISGHHDFFPKQCYGESNKKKGIGKELTLIIEGLNKSIKTDIGINGSNSKPRNFFRNRTWANEFFEKFEIREGDVIAIEKISKFKYRIYPFESKNVREGAFIPEHWPEINKKKPTVIDLFAGCGGLSIGFKNAGFENLLAIEWDKSCCDTFKANINLRILQCAIQEIDTFPSSDILMGGPPCQGFSNLGERVPNDPRRQLWRHFLRAVRDAKPLIFIMENVPPLLKSAEYKQDAEKMLVEVKGCTLVENELARFPDAPTTRGKKHVEELINALNHEFKSAILILILKEDAKEFSPNYDTDPDFSHALKRAWENGVKIVPFVFKSEYNQNTIIISPLKEIKFIFND